MFFLKGARTASAVANAVLELLPNNVNKAQGEAGEENINRFLLRLSLFFISLI
jgi:hypothetical protein